MKYPKDLKPVLAKIESITELGLSSWYEVIYYDDEYTKQWCSYAGSSTFQRGEIVKSWEYIENIMLKDNFVVD